MPATSATPLPITMACKKSDRDIVLHLLVVGRSDGRPKPTTPSSEKAAISKAAAKNRTEFPKDIFIMMMIRTRFGAIEEVYEWDGRADNIFNYK